VSEDYKVYLKKFRIAISIFAGSFLIVGFLIAKIVPEVQNIISIQDQQKTQTASLTEAERKLQGLKDSAEARKIETANVLKAFFKPIGGGSDTESVISDEFGEILVLMRENKIKTRSIQYDYDPQDDNFVKNVGSKYHVCRITAEMIANYANFESFLRELYKHDHFLEISKIEIVPYQKNKRILLINLQIKLYAQRDQAGIDAYNAEHQAQPATEAPKEQAQQSATTETKSNDNSNDNSNDF
jgi:hypothetical protein